VKEKLIESIEDSNWDFFVQAVKESKDLVNSVLRGNCDKVSSIIE